MQTMNRVGAWVLTLLFGSLVLTTAIILISWIWFSSREDVR